MQEQYRIYLGIDWGKQKHQAYALDEDRQVLIDQSFPHSADAVHELVNAVLALKGGLEPGQVAVGIEVRNGALVETFLERGFPVFFITPRQTDRLRDRYTAAGAKDDRRDAFVLADALRNDLHCFRRVSVDHPLIIQIRQVSRGDGDLRSELSRLTNQLREQLYRYFPQLLTLSPAADDPWLWDFIELAPSPKAARRLGRARLQSFLRVHRIRRFSVEEFVSQVEAVSFPVAPGTAEAAVAQIQLLIPRIRVAYEQRARCEKRLEFLFTQLAAEEPGTHSEQHRKLEILRSIPGVGTRVAGSLIAEAWELLLEGDYEALRLLTGVAPITRQSGKQRSVSMRYACNQHLRNAVFHWSRTAAQKDQYLVKAYAAHRARGHRHGRALRAIADRLLAMTCAMLRSGSLFDPERAGRTRNARPESAGGGQP